MESGYQNYYSNMEIKEFHTMDSIQWISLLGKETVACLLGIVVK